MYFRFVLLETANHWETGILSELLPYKLIPRATRRGRSEPDMVGLISVDINSYYNFDLSKGQYE